MPEGARHGQWVELHRVVLPPGGRAPSVPDDTRDLPLELRVRGWLVGDADLGDEATVRTPAGRLVSGTLESIAPAHLHTFGPPEPALLDVGRELRAFLQETRS